LYNLTNSDVFRCVGRPVGSRSSVVATDIIQFILQYEVSVFLRVTTHSISNHCVVYTPPTNSLIFIHLYYSLFTSAASVFNKFSVQCSEGRSKQTQ